MEGKRHGFKTKQFIMNRSCFIMSRSADRVDYATDAGGSVRLERAGSDRYRSLLGSSERTLFTNQPRLGTACAGGLGSLFEIF